MRKASYEIWPDLEMGWRYKLLAPNCMAPVVGHRLRGSRDDLENELRSAVRRFNGGGSAESYWTNGQAGNTRLVGDW